MPDRLAQIGLNEIIQPTVEHRLRLFGGHCEAFHEERIRRLEVRGGVFGYWSLDELETYEGRRNTRPLSLPK